MLKKFPIVDMCLSCEDIARQSCATVHTSNLRRQRLREEDKRLKEERTNDTMKIHMVCPIAQGDHK